MSTLVAQTISNGTVSTSSANVIRGSARAWVRYNGSTQTINASFNVSSVTRSSTGVFIVNFSTAMTDTNYAVCATGGSTTGYFARSGDDRAARTTTATTIVTFNFAGTDENPTFLGAAVFSS